MPTEVLSPRSSPLVVNASGTHGAAGTPGVVAQPGCDGGDATAAQPGGQGGAIDVYVHDDGIGQLAIDGECTSITGESSDVNVSVPAGTVVQLQANGGQGGRGANGGQGGVGHPGGAGQDGVLGAPATPGERGGTGGRGGAGSSGGAGGDGGDIRVQVGLDDLDLLAGVQTHVEGGEGGAPGVHAAGGLGGPGGQGGEDQRRTLFAVSTRRARGQTGYTGPTPSNPVELGQAGEPGRVEYVVNSPNGAKTYDQRYQVQLTHPRFARNGGRAFFGDPMKVTATATNTAPMPTPATLQGLRMEVAPSEHVRSQEVCLLPPSMVQNRPFATPPLTFVVDYPSASPARGQRQQLRTELELQVVSQRPNVALDESHLRFPLQVGHPVEMSAIEGDHVVLPNQPARIHWTLRNVSDRSLGISSQSGRALRCAIRVEGANIAGSQVLFVPEGAHAGAQPLQQAVTQAVRRLNSGQTMELRGQIMFSKGVPLYTQARIVVELHLDDIDQHNDRLIESHDFGMQLAQEQLRERDADMLLVVNRSTTSEEIAAWQKLAAELGTRANIWNMSVHGHVSLTEAVNGHPLGQEFAGKTVVLLNNAYNVDNGVDFATRHLAHGEFVLAAQRNGLTTYVVGPAGRFSLRDEVDPEHHSKVPQSMHHSIHNFERTAAAEQPTLGREVIEVRSRRLPRESALVSAQRELASWLSENYPERTYKLTAFFSPGRTSTVDTQKPHRLGTIQVSRGLDVGQRVVVENAVREDDMHKPTTITGASNRFGLCKALPFNTKLQALDRLAGDLKALSNPMVNPLMDAILSDLLDEQKALRGVGSASLGKPELIARLKRLNALTQFHFTPAASGSARFEIMTQLLGSMDAVMEGNCTPADRLLLRRPAKLMEIWHAMSARLHQRMFVTDEAREARAQVANDLLEKIEEPLPGARFPSILYAGVYSEYDVRPQESEMQDGAHPTQQAYDQSVRSGDTAVA